MMESFPELKDRLLDLYDAVSKGDGDLVEAVLTAGDGLVFIGTDPDEWFEDKRQVRSLLEAQADAGVGVIPGEITAHREGSVGWVSDKGAFKLPDGSEVPFRMTAVFHEEAGTWRMVQEHCSVAVTNEDAVGVEIKA
jgi:hypothetical protein